LCEQIILSHDNVVLCGKYIMNRIAVTQIKKEYDEGGIDLA